MAPVKRYAYDADFKLKANSHAVEHGNRAAATLMNQWYGVEEARRSKGDRTEFQREQCKMATVRGQN